MLDASGNRLPSVGSLLFLSKEVCKYLRSKSKYEPNEMPIVEAMNVCLVESGLKPLRLISFDSPLEETFWEFWTSFYAVPLMPQYEVFGGKYRIDFAHLSSRTAVELDGVTYHENYEAFARDRRRDRELQREGWAVLRYTGDEVRDGIETCAYEVNEIIASRGD